MIATYFGAFTTSATKASATPAARAISVVMNPSAEKPMTTSSQWATQKPRAPAITATAPHQYR